MKKVINAVECGCVIVSLLIGVLFVSSKEKEQPMAFGNSYDPK